MEQRKAILLSIKPKFAKAIYDGTKLIELRKSLPNVPIGTLVYMYETKPVGKVTGYFVFNGIETGEKHWFWMDYGRYTCVQCQAYWDYYEGHKNAVGWLVKKPTKWPVPVSLRAFGLSRPPQSYCFVTIEL